jgi:hypothetical protein
MMFAKEAEALAYAEPLVPKRYHTWLRVLTQWKNEKERTSDPDRWVKYFCPYFTTEGLLRQAWDDARRVSGTDGRKLVRIVTAWHVEGQYLVWSAEVETPFGLATGHATANLGDGAKGVDAKNPFENGETSAIARALRHLGYGFGFETDDEPAVTDDANGHAGESAAAPANGKAANGGSISAASASPTAAPAATKPTAKAPDAKGATGKDHDSTADFNQVRNEVLSLARRVSSTSKQDIATVVSQVSDGAFQYSEIGRMTPADLPKLQAAAQHLRDAVKPHVR